MQAETRVIQESRPAKVGQSQGGHLYVVELM